MPATGRLGSDVGAIRISTYKQVWNALITILNTAQALPDTGPLSIGYVKDIRYGAKNISDIPELPAIIVTPVSDKEEQHNIAQYNYKRVFWTISLQCWLKAIEKDTQVTGEITLSDGVTLKGISDFEADVKNVINNHPDLDGVAMTLKFPNTSTLFEVWPNQVCDIEMVVEFITPYNGR